MLTALTIISLLSLLVATEAEPAGSRVDAATSEPLRPKGKACCMKDDDSDRLAA
jgi:hypothetical protein